MADWFTTLANQAMKIADDFADSLVAQANDAQEQIRREQAKLKEEEEIKKQTLCSNTQLPWETEDESLQILCDSLRESILKLSLNDGNFTTEPPNASEVHFVFADFIATALQLLKLDANLAHVHSKVSPKMDEEVFWRNYYCRVIYLRAIIGVDGAAAKEEAAKWKDSGVVLEPDYSFVSKGSSTLSSATGITPVTSKRAPAKRRGDGTPASKKALTPPPPKGSNAPELSDEELMRQIQDEHDEADEEVSFSAGHGHGAEAHRDGAHQVGGECEGDAEEPADADIDVDADEDDEIDLGDLDDMDLLRELSEMEGDGEGDGDTSSADRGAGGTKKADRERERGELGSYEEVGKSDCNSSSSNAELEAQIAMELANLSDDD